MKFRIKVLLLLAFNIPLIAFTQNDLNNNLVGITSQKLQDTTVQINFITDTIHKQNPLINFNSYFILLGGSLKDEFTKPFHMKKRDWGNFGKFAAIAITLSFADKPVQQAALRLRNQNTGLNTISKDVSNFGGIYEVATVAGIGAFGLISKNNKLVNTTLLSSQAYITGGAVETVLKLISGRTRPSYYAPGVEAKPRFLGPFHKSLRDADGSNENSSFPSGHATVAFAVATVFASEYKDKPIVPVIAYTAASMIGVSRITENKHWVTDVVTGAAIGYLSGKLVVKNYHRFNKYSSTEPKKNLISFALNYSFGHLEPGVVYQFR